MEITVDQWNIISYLANVAGLVSFAVQLTMWLCKRNKDRQLQYLMKGIADVATLKGNAWSTQLQLSSPNDATVGVPGIRLIKKASDEFQELAQLALALEKSIDTNSSASSHTLEDVAKAQKRLREIDSASKAHASR